jgi:hypothetical protein
MVMTTYNFAAFILTHGRPNKVVTYTTLRKQGYTGKIYLIVDNEDSTLNEYLKNFGDEVIVFDKKEVAERIDTGDNTQERRAAVFARNANFDIARRLGIDYFLQLDDDYSCFSYLFSSNLMYREKAVKHSLDKIFQIVLEYFINVNALTIAFCQGGDLIGGSNNQMVKAIKIKRKAMNSFFCSIHRPFEFTMRFNDDVNMYIRYGNRGALIFTLYNVRIHQPVTQKIKGGMTEIYLEEGTYPKAFSSVMIAPSFVKVSVMSNRIHHKIKWDNAVPCIIEEKYRKPPCQ